MSPSSQNFLEAVSRYGFWLALIAILFLLLDVVGDQRVRELSSRLEKTSLSQLDRLFRHTPEGAKGLRLSVRWWDAGGAKRLIVIGGYLLLIYVQFSLLYLNIHLLAQPEFQVLPVFLFVAVISTPLLYIIPGCTLFLVYISSKALMVFIDQRFVRTPVSLLALAVLIGEVLLYFLSS